MATYRYSLIQTGGDFAINRSDNDGSNSKMLLKVDDSTGNVEVGNNGVGSSLLTLFDNAVSRKSVSFIAPTPLSASFTLDLPPADGSNNQVLTVDDSNGMQWSTTNFTILEYGLNSTISNQQKEIKTMNQSSGSDGYRASTAGIITNITVNCECSVFSSSGTFTVKIFKNGSDSGVALTSNSVSGTGFIRQTGAVTLAVAQGDTISCFVTVPSSFTIRKTAVLFALNAA